MYIIFSLFVCESLFFQMITWVLGGIIFSRVMSLEKVKKKKKIMFDPSVFLLLKSFKLFGVLIVDFEEG